MQNFLLKGYKIDTEADILQQVRIQKRQEALLKAQQLPYTEGLSSEQENETEGSKKKVPKKSKYSEAG